MRRSQTAATEEKNVLQTPSALMFCRMDEKSPALLSAERDADFCSKAAFKVSILPRTLRINLRGSFAPSATTKRWMNTCSRAPTKLPSKNMKPKFGCVNDEVGAIDLNRPRAVR